MSQTEYSKESTRRQAVSQSSLDELHLLYLVAYELIVALCSTMETGIYNYGTA